jgi:O-antigen ligase/polysaccharide polymerase Wzy-like membrane protein
MTTTGSPPTRRQLPLQNLSIPTLGRNLHRIQASRPALVLPGALTAWLGFHAGGFFPGATAQAALATLLVLVFAVTLAERPLDPFGALALVVLAGLAGFATWTLLSSAESGAPGRALLEFDRALLYVAAFAAGVTLTRARADLSVLLRWTAAALFAIALLGALSRLLPGLVEISTGNEGERLAFPVTYWNAMGVACALGGVLALHAASGDREPPAVRVLATAALPVFVVAGYFPFSRGGIAAGALAAVLYLVLALPRRAVPALLCAAPACAIALASAYGGDLLATEQYASAAGRDEGRTVALVLAGCVLGAGAARAALVVFLEPRLDRLRIRRPGVPAIAAAAVLAVALVAVVAVAADAPARIDREVQKFSEGNVVETGDARDRLSQTAGNGRTGFWRVALDVAAEHRLTGSGAGTYRVEWERRRPYAQQANDGHSLYLETLAELGLLGAVLLFVPLVLILGAAASRLLGPDRMAHAAFLAAGGALLVHAGLDWDWEMPVLFAWFFVAAGAVCASLPVRESGGPGRITRILLALALLGLALTPISLIRSESALREATRAFAARECPTAIDASLRSIGAVSQRPEPFEILGYCDLRLGARELGLRAFRSAVARDPDSWTPRYGLAVAKALTGQDPRPDAAAALRRNPQQPEARALVAALERGGRRRWAREAAKAQIP